MTTNVETVVLVCFSAKVQERELGEFLETLPKTAAAPLLASRPVEQMVQIESSNLRITLVKTLADFELKFGDSVPSGTYLDMAVNMPMVDPTRLACPTCLVRPERRLTTNARPMPR